MAVGETVTREWRWVFAYLVVPSALAYTFISTRLVPNGMLLPFLPSQKQCRVRAAIKLAPPSTLVALSRDVDLPALALLVLHPSPSAFSLRPHTYRSWRNEKHKRTWKLLRIKL